MQFSVVFLALCVSGASAFAPAPAARATTVVFNEPEMWVELSWVFSKLSSMGGGWMLSNQINSIRSNADIHWRCSRRFGLVWSGVQLFNSSRWNAVFVFLLSHATSFPFLSWLPFFLSIELNQINQTINLQRCRRYGWYPKPWCPRWWRCP